MLFTNTISFDKIISQEISEVMDRLACSSMNYKFHSFNNCDLYPKRSIWTETIEMIGEMGIFIGMQAKNKFFIETV